MNGQAWIFCRPHGEVITGIHVPGDVLLNCDFSSTVVIGLHTDTSQDISLTLKKHFKRWNF